MKRFTKVFRDRSIWRGHQILRIVAPAVLLPVALAACSVDSTKTRFLLAERLWEEGDYKAAVAEFERVAARDRYGVLGKRAVLRAAITQGFFLQQYPAALKKLRDFIESEGDTPDSWEARRTIGNILFDREQNFEQALIHYQDMLALRPEAPEAGLYLERIAQSHFNLSQFDEAYDVFAGLADKMKGTEQGERASLSLGQILYTQGDQRPPRRFSSDPKGVYSEAIRMFEAFISTYPASKRIYEAHFGIASCLAELDQLEKAEAILESLQSKYPSPGVVAVKLARIRERQTSRGATRSKRTGTRLSPRLLEPNTSPVER